MIWDDTPHVIKELTIVTNALNKKMRRSPPWKMSPELATWYALRYSVPYSHVIKELR
nr:hypothetical protein [Candidatus Sigynarchaeota archaeon]